MKKLIIPLFVLLMLSVPAVIFASSCESAGEELPDYYISFSVDGQEYIMSFGVSGVEVNPFATVEGGSATYFFATDDNTASTEIEPEDYILIWFVGTEASDYTAGEDLMDFLYYIADARWELSSGTITITAFGDVGEAIEGTFIITLTDTATETETMDLENGKFRLLRIADDTYFIWD